MLIKNLLIVVAGLTYIALVALAFLNTHNTTMTLLGQTITLPLTVVLVIYMLFSSVASSIFTYYRRRNSKAEHQKLTEWQTQDAKLVAQIKSDREKQLEAKVATLEAALKSALKK